MLVDFPQGFGYDPTVIGASGRKSGEVPGMSGLGFASRTHIEASPLPIILVADELLPIDPQHDADQASYSDTGQSPFLTTAVIGFILAGAGYFVGFH